MACPLGQQRAREAAGARPDFDRGADPEIACGTRDAAREIEIEEKMLAQRFARRKTVLSNDLGERRQAVGGGRAVLRRPVDRRQARMSITATRRRSRR
jgi:hypothetical protein